MAKNTYYSIVGELCPPFIKVGGNSPLRPHPQLPMCCDYYIYSKSIDYVLYLISILAFQFTFTPSPEAKIEVYQLAHYRCSVDYTGVSTTWLVNGTDSANSKIIQLNVVTNGAGSSNSSLTIPGYPQYNNTIVTCNAFGFVNGNSYFKSSESILRIQGNTSFDTHFNYFVL